ncbi:MAG: DUF2927 domain-containing protein [Pseudomonadota bacterium]
MNDRDLMTVFPCVRRLTLAVAHIAVFALIASCARQPTAAEYAQYTETLIALGDLRTETAPSDAPFTNADLIRNFSRIALRHEVDIEQIGSDANAAPNPLQRWEAPIRYRLFGAGVTMEDVAETASFLNRLAHLTGLEIEPATEDVNLMILVTDRTEREQFSRALRQLNPGLGDSFDAWRQSRAVVCMATNLFSRDAPDEIVFGMVVIGSEVTGLLRQSCLHEEITQALGLGNDHPEVRPSIFNDDEEFALLTEHDEWLLRILYDRRLEIGMTDEEALPLVRQIVSDIRPGPS